MGSVRRARQAASLACVLVLATRPVEAEESSPDERYNAAPTIAERRWYGWQTLTADLGIQVAGGGVYAIAYAGDATRGEKRAIEIVTVAAWAGASPIIHALHAHPGKALGSLGLRLGGPLVTGFGGGIIGWYTSKKSEKGAEDGASLGILAGMIAVTIIDAAAIAREDVYRDELRPYGLRTFTLVPAPTGAGLVAGAGGVF
jgi:hypothetical protein